MHGLEREGNLCARAQPRPNARAIVFSASDPVEMLHKMYWACQRTVSSRQGRLSRLYGQKAHKGSPSLALDFFCHACAHVHGALKHTLTGL